MKNEHQKLFEQYRTFEGEAAFDERTARGRQPVLDICGYPYFVNLRSGQLEPVNFPLVKAITLKDLENINVFSATRYFYYSPASKE